VSGIAGIVRFDGGPVDRELLEKMADFQAFRGPHGRGIWCDGNVGFIHTLFKLNDDDPPAPQPLTLDGKVWITAHARIDAQDDLIPALRGRGREVMKGTSDAELLLHAYHAWGERCLEHLLGDFTFAIWDGRERRLFCAVDHFGIRPFYYAHIANALVFSNTLDCIRVLPSISQRLDDTAVGDFLLFGQYIDLDRTIYADVRRIPRAHRLQGSRNAVTVSRYWEMSDDDELDGTDPGAIVEDFRSRLLNATRDRLRTRNVAVFMSGGLDSTLVTAMGVEALSARDAPWCVTPFTIVFRGLIGDDEDIYGREAAAYLGLEHKLLNGAQLVPFDWAERCAWPPPQPPADPAWGLHVSRMREVGKTARLALSGWEGDEPLRAWLPAHWRRLIIAGEFSRLLRDVFRYVTAAKGPPPVGARTGLVRLRRRLFPDALPDWLGPDFARRARLSERQSEWRYAQARAFYSGSRARYVERVPWAGVFDTYDAEWTGCAIQTAHPLMDVRLISWLTRMPPVPWSVGKRLFREAAKGFMPQAIVNRPKTPLSADPAEAAFRQAPVRIPLAARERAKRWDYVDWDRLFDSRQLVRSDRGLGTISNAISVLQWIGRKESPSIAPPVAQCTPIVGVPMKESCAR
jgi:asparagine synthase (glutamine-hydrolysing)